jgi:hypothetical protein
MESSLPPTYTYTEACTQKACMSILTPYKHWCESHWKFMHSFPFISNIEGQNNEENHPLLHQRQSPFPKLEELLHI